MGSFDNAFMEYSPEFDEMNFEDSEWTGDTEVFTESELMELADELLQVQSEDELDQFLGNLIKKVGRGIGKVVKSPVGRAIGGFLKGAAKKALPLAGAAVGGFFGGPLGAKIGKGLASAAGGVLGLEAEALSAEDQEFEGAKQFCRLCGASVKTALTAPPGADPMRAAHRAITTAASRHAPGLLGGVPPSVGPRASGNAGRWVRKGRNVLLLNL